MASICALKSVCQEHEGNGGYERSIMVLGTGKPITYLPGFQVVNAIYSATWISVDFFTSISRNARRLIALVQQARMSSARNRTTTLEKYAMIRRYWLKTVTRAYWENSFESKTRSLYLILKHSSDPRLVYCVTSWCSSLRKHNFSSSSMRTRSAANLHLLLRRDGELAAQASSDLACPRAWGCAIR